MNKSRLPVAAGPRKIDQANHAHKWLIEFLAVLALFGAAALS
jgi:hypothetical protein